MFQTLVMSTCRDQQMMQVNAAAVWRVMIDLPRWPVWTDSMQEITALQPGAPAVGHRFKVRQPRIPDAVYTIKTVDPGRSFSWEAGRRGVTTKALHEVEANGDGCRVTLSLSWAGPLAGAVWLLFGPLTRTYLRRELEGLQSQATKPLMESLYVADKPEQNKQ